MYQGSIYLERQVRQHSSTAWGVALVSTLTGDVKGWVSLHDTKREAVRALKRTRGAS